MPAHLSILHFWNIKNALSSSIPIISLLNASHLHLSIQILSYSSDCSSYSSFIMSFLTTLVRSNFPLFQHSDKIYFEQYKQCYSHLALDSKLISFTRFLSWIEIIAIFNINNYKSQDRLSCGAVTKIFFWYSGFSSDHVSLLPFTKNCFWVITANMYFCVHM